MEGYQFYKTGSKDIILTAKKTFYTLKSGIQFPNKVALYLGKKPALVSMSHVTYLNPITEEFKAVFSYTDSKNCLISKSEINTLVLVHNGHGTIIKLLPGVLTATDISGERVEQILSYWKTQKINITNTKIN